MNRRLTVLLAGIALVLAGAAAASPADEDGTADKAAEPSALVATVAVARHRLTETIVAFGRVQADPGGENTVAVPRDGQVVDVLVRVGERIEAGATLFHLQTAPSGHMAYDQARQAVDYARAELARQQRLFAERLATTDQVATARQALAKAEADFALQSKLGTGEAVSAVRAPFAGIVTKLMVAPGERVTLNAAALRIADGHAFVVPLGIEPEQAALIKPGAPVTLKSLFDPRVTANGSIQEVHAVVDPATRLVDALARMPDGKAAPLVIGMQVKGIITQRTEESLAVPRSAVLHDDKGAYLFVVRDGHAARIDVKTDIEQDGLIAVSGPLSVGDPVVVRGNYEARDGMKVREGGS